MLLFAVICCYLPGLWPTHRKFTEKTSRKFSGNLRKNGIDFRKFPDLKPQDLNVFRQCMLLFGCSVLTVISERKAKFVDDYLQSYNILCRLFAYVAENEKEELQYCIRSVTGLLQFIHIIS